MKNAKACLFMLALACPSVASAQDAFPAGATFPPHDPKTAGIVGVYAQEISMQMMFCHQRSQQYADVIKQAVMQLYFRLPQDQQNAAMQIINSNGDDIPDAHKMGLPSSCESYAENNRFSGLIQSMDHFVDIVNNQ
jgi:hypothetical protein